MNISIIIPNYNGKELLRKNLPKVLLAAKHTEIIIVDDASEDGSTEMLRKDFPGLRVIKKSRNEGFASTVNEGVRAAGGEIVILLNSDAYPERGFLEPLLTHFQNPSVFAVGFLQKSEEQGREVRHGRGLGTFMRGFLIHSAGEPDKETTLWVSGGAGAFRKKIWTELGGMERLYNPYYWEDIDLSYRAAKAGYTVIFEPKSIVRHTQDEGAIRTHFSEEKIREVAYRNQFIFVWLNITDSALISQHIFFLPYHLLSAIARGDIPFLRGFLEALKRLMQVLRRRKELKAFGKRKDKELWIR